MRIRYEGTLATFSGFSQAVQDNIMALRSLTDRTPGAFGIQLDVRHLPDGEMDGILPRYEPILPLVDAHKEHDWPTHWIVHTTPFGFRDNTPPRGAYKRIAYTAWETSRVEPAEVAYLNEFDCVIVPCEFNRDVFKRSGVNARISVVPHAYDPTWWVPMAPPDRDHRPYTFYSIAVWNERKNPLGLLKAYFHAFTADDYVQLRILCPNPRLEEVELLQRLMKLENPPRVEFVGGGKKWIGQTEHRRFHYDGHCYVTLARGEGWGLGAFEAMLVGNPVIATAYGAHREFLDGENDHLIPYTLTPCVQARIGITGKQLWAEPDLEVAALSMRNAFGHYPNNGWRERDGKFHGFEKVYGYQAIGEEFIEVLRGL